MKSNACALTLYFLRHCLMFHFALFRDITIVASTWNHSR